MKDQFGRNIDYMRISVTNACNLSCRYCMPEKREQFLRELSVEEVCSVVRIAKQVGISHFRFTGGEPLLAKGLLEMLEEIQKMDGISSYTLTTNGILLGEQASDLKKRGIHGINVSLDTVNPREYAGLTGRNCLPQVMEGIKEAVRQAIPVKLNVVLREETDIKALVRCGISFGVDVRFIEMMPIGKGREYPVVSGTKVLHILEEEYGSLEEEENRAFYEKGPARYFRLPEGSIRVGLIQGIHGKFCNTCNRIRLTSEGILKSCLGHTSSLDLLSERRKSRREEEVVEILRRWIYNKPESHCFECVEAISEQRWMSEIGG